MSWVKCHRSVESVDLLRSKPNAFLLLYLIASRAWRGGSGNPHNLSVAEALIGDSDACGLTRGKHRAALNQLKSMGYITTKTTNKGTIAKLEDTTIFDPNFILSENSTTIKTTNQGHESNQSTATNKKFNNCKKFNNNWANKSFSFAQEQICSKPTKALSMYALRGRKEAYEAEFKEIQNRGSEFPMGFEYDSKNDRLRAKELKKLIRETNRAMQDAV
jgi:hypothetical protein